MNNHDFIVKENERQKKNKRKQKQFLKNSKAFTLIELLAVIIILAILLIIAIPSVSNYIGDSRKSAYVASAKAYISSARFLLNNGKLKAYDTSATYYIPAKCLQMENDIDSSPYGKWKDRYIVTTFDGRRYDYYWASTDESEVGIELVNEDELDVDKIETGISTISPNVLIDGTDKVLVLNDNCFMGDWIDKTSGQSGGQGGNSGGDTPDVTLPTQINNTTWKLDVLTLRMEQEDCWNSGSNKKRCNVTVYVTNSGETSLTAWTASFILPHNTSIVSNSLSFASLSLDGDKVTLTGLSDFWHFISPGETKSNQIQIEMDRDYNLSLDDGKISYTFLSNDVQEGQSPSGVKGNAEDMNIDLATINVELKRKNYWGNAGDYSAIYDVIITNTSNFDISNWSFDLVLPSQIKVIEAWNVVANNIGDSTYRIGLNEWSNKRNIQAKKSVTISDAFRFGMTDINAMPDIK